MPRCFAGGPPNLECQDSVWMRERVTAGLQGQERYEELRPAQGGGLAVPRPEPVFAGHLL